MPRGGGSHMGGGRSSMGSSHRSGGSHSSFRSSSSTHRTYSTRSSFGTGPRPGFGPRVRTGYYGRRSGGAFALLLPLIFLPIIFISVINTVIYSNNNTTIHTTVVEKEREPLPHYGAFDSNCVIDELGWIYDQGEIVDGLEYFYDHTGIQPLVILTDDSQLFMDDMDETYENYFNEENGFIYIFESNSDEITYYTGNDYYITGYAADNIMDDEAMDIFWDCIENNWSRNEFGDGLGNAFIEASDRIMGTPSTVIIDDPITDTQDHKAKSNFPYFVIAIIGVALLITFFTKRKAKKNAADIDYGQQYKDEHTDDGFNPYYGDGESYSDQFKNQ